ncbi:MAG: ABC transporter ATP-binding protein [Atribacterota bacterium]
MLYATPSILAFGGDTLMLLEVKNLRVYFRNSEGQELRAVDGISFSVPYGKTVALVGESGCGKSVTALAILRLVEVNGWIAGGEVLFEGKNLLTLSEKEMQGVRGKDIAIIFQEPSAALNPVYTIGDQIIEAILLHQSVSREKARALAEEMLHLVGIPEPRKRLNAYPHELSGGMKQRAMIAMALSCRPKLLIADEPTTALDVTIQAQILTLLRDLQKQIGMAILLITHDLGIVADMADEVVVMYAGKVVERGRKYDIFKHCCHPYTIGLLRSVPRLDVDEESLVSIPGFVPDPLHFPEGCRFRGRCFLEDETCCIEPPEVSLGNGHLVYCHHVVSSGVCYEKR